METTKGLRITSYILQGIIGIMFLLGAIGNLMESEMAIKGATDLGYDESSVFTLGVLLLIATVLYLVPKTAILGTALLTAWLGGAVATHIIHQDPTINQVMPAIFGIVIWVSLWLRMDNLRKVFPLG